MVPRHGDGLFRSMLSHPRERSPLVQEHGNISLTLVTISDKTYLAAN
jgi:hypothetical protein